MLGYLIAFAAAQVSGATAATPPTNQAPVQAAPATPAKKKRPKVVCANTEAMTGSYLIPCEAPDPRDQELKQMNGAALLRFAPADGSMASSAASTGPR